MNFGTDVAQDIYCAYFRYTLTFGICKRFPTIGVVRGPGGRPASREPIVRHRINAAMRRGMRTKRIADDSMAAEKRSCGKGEFILYLLSDAIAPGG